jgi:hypothetical protein
MELHTNIKTSYGRAYRLIGYWHSDAVFAPTDGKDAQVLIVTESEIAEFLKSGEFAIQE